MLVESVPAVILAPEPLVSVLMPLYNEEKYLPTALESLFAQENGNFELLISDNCSTDGTWDIARDYAKRDSRIRCERQQANVGVVRNTAALIARARGRYAMLAAGHDCWKPQFITRCCEILSSDPTVILAYPKAEWIDIDGRPMGAVPGNFDTRGMNPPWRVNIVLWGLKYSFHAYGVVRREALGNMPTQPMLAPDNLFLVACAFDGAFAQVPETLFSMRMLENFGDWDVYQQKIFGGSPTTGPEPPSVRYFRMVEAFLEMIARRQPPGYERDALMFTASSCLLTKYLAFLSGVDSGQSSAVESVQSFIEDMARQLIQFVEKHDATKIAKSR